MCLSAQKVTTYQHERNSPDHMILDMDSPNRRFVFLNSRRKPRHRAMSWHAIARMMCLWSQHRRWPIRQDRGHQDLTRRAEPACWIKKILFVLTSPDTKWTLAWGAFFDIRYLQPTNIFSLSMSKVSESRPGISNPTTNALKSAC